MATLISRENLRILSVQSLEAHQQILRVWAEDVWFKPVESGAREKGNGIVDFVGIRCKCSGSVIKVQLEGHNESLEFPQVRAIESIRLFDLGADVVRSRVV